MYSSFPVQGLTCSHDRRLLREIWDAGLEVGLDKTHWSSSVALEGEALVVRGQNIAWERKLEFIGSVIEPGAHSGGAVRHRS